MSMPPPFMERAFARGEEVAGTIWSGLVVHRTSRSMSAPVEACHFERAAACFGRQLGRRAHPVGWAGRRLGVDERAVRRPALPDPGALDYPLVARVEQGHDVLVGDNRRSGGRSPSRLLRSLCRTSSPTLSSPQPGNGLAGLDPFARMGEHAHQFAGKGAPHLGARDDAEQVTDLDGRALGRRAVTA